MFLLVVFVDIVVDIVDATVVVVVVLNKRAEILFYVTHSKFRIRICEIIHSNRLS
jgi:hypothetical protein